MYKTIFPNFVWQVYQSEPHYTIRAAQRTDDLEVCSGNRNAGYTSTSDSWSLINKVLHKSDNSHNIILRVQ